MKRWIAYEHDEGAGWPTEAYLVASADTQDDAKRVMAAAIARQGSAADLADRWRYWAIFIEAPCELADDDSRGAGDASPVDPVFWGFDQPRARRRPTAPRRV